MPFPASVTNNFTPSVIIFLFLYVLKCWLEMHGCKTSYFIWKITFRSNASSSFFTFYFYHYQSATKMKVGEHSSNHMTLAYTWLLVWSVTPYQSFPPSSFSAIQKYRLYKGCVNWYLKCTWKYKSLVISYTGSLPKIYLICDPKRSADVSIITKGAISHPWDKVWTCAVTGWMCVLSVQCLQGTPGNNFIHRILLLKVWS